MRDFDGGKYLQLRFTVYSFEFMVAFKFIYICGVKKIFLNFIFCSAVLLMPLFSSAQKTITTYHNDSSFVFTRDNRLDELIARQKDINSLKNTITGYRIQIYFGGVRQKAAEAKIDFTKKHTDLAAYLTYSAPNFKVRVGDFRTRLEAMRFMKTIEGQYTTTFIVPDEVKMAELK